MKETTTFEEQLDRKGILVYTTRGCSMMPLLREGKDIIVIRKASGEDCRKYDAVLFIREHVSGRGRYVLHRILKENPDGSFWIVGDHCLSGENVKKDKIIGILSEVVRGGRKISVSSWGYRAYVHLWCDFFHVRCLLIRGKSFIRRCLSFAKRKASNFFV